MPRRTPSTVIATYRVRTAKEREFRAQLRDHWPTLHALGLVTDDPPEIFRYEDHRGRPTYFEVYSWKDAAAVEAAHAHPEVLAVWARFEECLENRDGRRKWEFPSVERVTFGAKPRKRARPRRR